MKFRLSVIGFFFVVAVLAVQLCAQLTGDTVTVPSFLKKEKNVIEFNGCRLVGSVRWNGNGCRTTRILFLG